MADPRKGSDGAGRSAKPVPQAGAAGKRKRAGPDQTNGGSASAAPGYDVGYRKPPRHTQFKKGQPRPPRKPKPEDEPSFEDYFEEELRTPMKFVDETGKDQVMPKGKVLAKASVNKALKSGDIRQIKDFIPRRPAKKDNEVAKADIELIARFLAHQFGIELPPVGRDDEGDAGGATPDEEGDQ